MSMDNELLERSRTSREALDIVAAYMTILEKFTTVEM